MTSRAGQLVASARWGVARPPARSRLAPRVRFEVRPAAAAELAGAALVLGGTVGLWAAVLLAVR